MIATVDGATLLFSRPFGAFVKMMQKWEIQSCFSRVPKSMKQVQPVRPMLLSEQFPVHIKHVTSLSVAFTSQSLSGFLYMAFDIMIHDQ